MPRIELEPPDIKEIIDRGDGSPTIDICLFCVLEGFEEGELLPDYIQEDFPEETTVTCLDVEHPPYTDDDYQCHRCGDKLTDGDN